MHKYCGRIEPALFCVASLSGTPMARRQRCQGYSENKTPDNTCVSSMMCPYLVFASGRSNRGILGGIKRIQILWLCDSEQDEPVGQKYIRI